LLGLLDAIWSAVRGIDGGLLPTEVQLGYLERAIGDAKALWLTMGLGTQQPKWHMTFDGHLLHQVRMYGGVADKADDTIEFQHQILMRLKDRFRSVPSYRKREICIQRELRREKSPEIESHIAKYKASINGKTNSKRAIETTERQQSTRDAKRVKREGFLQGL